MLELSKKMKYRELPDHIREGLAPFSIYQIKFMVWGFTYFLLDLLIIMPLLFPIMKPILYITIPPMVIMSIWAFRLLIKKPEDSEMEFLLFLGFLGVVGSFCYFVVVMKYHYMIGIKSPIYYTAMFLIYLSFIYLFLRNEHKKYSSLETKMKKKTPTWHYTLAMIAPGAGYIFAQYLMGLSGFYVLSIMSLVFWGLSLTFTFLIGRGFHKYFFIKKNIHLVTFAKKELNQKYKSPKVGN